MEDKEKKAKPSAKSVAAPKTAAKAASKTTATKAAKPAAPKADAAASEKPKTSPKKVVAAAIAAEKPAAKSKTVKAATVAAAAPTVKKAAAKKPATDAPAAEKPAAKVKAVKAAPISAAAAPAEKKASAKKPAAEPAAEKPAAKSKAVKAATTVAAAAAPAAKKSAVKKAAPAEPAAEKPAAKSKKAPASAADKPAAEPKSPEKGVAATEGAATVEGEKKIRTKPRRRELKRQGLWVPKEQRGKYGKMLAAAQAEKDLTAPAKGKPTPQPDKKDETRVAKSSPAPMETKSSGKKADHKEKWDKEPSVPERHGKSSDSKKPKAVPTEFNEFVKRPSEKAERKQDRRQEKVERQARQVDQSQGLFEEAIRLNRFVALSGVCSRRDADALIKEGKVKVNGKVVKEMGHKVMPGTDKVVYKDHELRIKVFVYLLMNKPKNHISTTDDERGRDTVMEIAERYTKARVYPVGRLDRNTTGLLLLTNDGDLTMKLTHPSSKFPKVYNARLDRDISDADLQSLRKGFDLEDGFIKADKVHRTSVELGNEIGLEIHSGANHIVKRMLAHLGYEVVTLDRVKLGPLGKQGLRRGTCRLLSDKEVGFLKML